MKSDTRRITLESSKTNAKIMFSLTFKKLSKIVNFYILRGKLQLIDEFI